MTKRIFLGYKQPFVSSLADWLLKEPDSLASTLVIVPTAQSGRTLREHLAKKAGAILSPTFATPGSMLRIDSPEVAPTWIEKVIWVDVLTSIRPGQWKEFTGLFPEPPNYDSADQDWAYALAQEIVTIRASLQEHQHNLFSASKFLQETPDADRWQDLAKLEDLFEKRLSQIGLTSKTTKLREGLEIRAGYDRIILAGVTELPECLVTALESYGSPVEIVIAAPETDNELFSNFGIPTKEWIERKLPAIAEVAVRANPKDQSAHAMKWIGETSASSDQIALGSADESVGQFLIQDLKNLGWSAYHPAAAQLRSPLSLFLQTWIEWIREPDCQNLISLISLPASSTYVSVDRASLVKGINQIRDKKPAIDPASVVGIASSRNQEGDEEIQTAVQALLTARLHFLEEKPAPAIRGLLAKLTDLVPAVEDEPNRVRDFMLRLEKLAESIRRPHAFWLQMLIGELPKQTPLPPDDRVIDIQGWLELLYEPGENLLITGMNEGFAPAKLGNDQWISEGVREALGINSQKDRHARDSYLLYAMSQMRSESGKVQLIAGKTSQNGDTHLPSRLLLNVDRDRLVSTVRTLFREIEPPESNLVWERDWPWKTPQMDLPEKISVTGFTDYLSCPFRFYMKHIVRAQKPEPNRREMNHRDFGSLLHEVLEIWGRDTTANLLTDANQLSEFLIDLLSAEVTRIYGFNVPLPIRIQVSSMEQRLEWFAEEQAKLTKDGWRIIDVERKFEISSNGFQIRGMIDRIDKHTETGELRIIDYKTGKKDTAEKAHRKAIKGNSNPPIHLPTDAAPFSTKENAKGKEELLLWIDLQLPIYVLGAIHDHSSSPLIPTYFLVGKTKKDVRISTWDSFDTEDLDSARQCMDWITEQIRAKHFWPPAERATYDDLADLVPDKKFEEAFTAP